MTLSMAVKPFLLLTSSFMLRETANHTYWQVVYPLCVLILPDFLWFRRHGVVKDGEARGGEHLPVDELPVPEVDEVARGHDAAGGLGAHLVADVGVAVDVLRDQRS